MFPGLIYTILSIIAQVPGDAPKSRDDLYCGAYCLYVSLRALDVPVANLEELEKRLGKPTSMGFSMAAMEQAARSYGIHTSAVTTNLSNLAEREGRLACIALLERQSHFVCISDISDKMVTVIDPPGSSKLSRQSFELIWDGKALLLSNKEIIPLPAKSLTFDSVLIAICVSLCIAFLIGLIHRLMAGGGNKSLFKLFQRNHCLLFALIVDCNLGCQKDDTLGGQPVASFSSRFISLGTLSDTLEKSNGKFTISNVGDKDLMIQSVQSSCGCTLVQPKSLIIKPNESSELQFEVRLKNEVGDHRSNITVFTNDPINPKQDLTVSWTEQFWLIPQPGNVHFQSVNPGLDSSCLIEFLTNEDISSESLKIKTDSTSLKAAWVDNSELEKTKVNNQFRVKRTCKVVFTPKPDELESGISFVEVYLDGSKKNVRVPVKWDFDSNITVSPRALYCSSPIPGSKIQNKFVIRKPVDKSLVLSSISIDDKPIVFEMKEFGDHLELVVSVPVEVTPGFYQKSIVWKFKDLQKEIMTPLSYQIKK